VKKRTCKCGYNETKKIPATKKHSTYTVYEVPSKYPDNIEYHYAMEKCSKTGKIVSEKKEKHDFVAEMEHESVRLDFGNNYIYTRKLKVCYCNVVKLDERWVQNGKDKRVPNIQFYFTNAKMRDK